MTFALGVPRPCVLGDRWCAGCYACEDAERTDRDRLRAELADRLLHRDGDPRCRCRPCTEARLQRELFGSGILTPFVGEAMTPATIERLRRAVLEEVRKLEPAIVDPVVHLEITAFAQLSIHVTWRDA